MPGLPLDILNVSGDVKAAANPLNSLTFKKHSAVLDDSSIGVRLLKMVSSWVAKRVIGKY